MRWRQGDTMDKSLSQFFSRATLKDKQPFTHTHTEPRPRTKPIHFLLWATVLTTLPAEVWNRYENLMHKTCALISIKISKKIKLTEMLFEYTVWFCLGKLALAPVAGGFKVEESVSKSMFTHRSAPLCTVMPRGGYLNSCHGPPKGWMDGLSCCFFFSFLGKFLFM